MTPVIPAGALPELLIRALGCALKCVELAGRGSSEEAPPRQIREAWASAGVVQTRPGAPPEMTESPGNLIAAPFLNGNGPASWSVLSGEAIASSRIHEARRAINLRAPVR
jgi:hypothetical protein